MCLCVSGPPQWPPHISIVASDTNYLRLAMETGQMQQALNADEVSAPVFIYIAFYILIC